MNWHPSMCIRLVQRLEVGGSCLTVEQKRLFSFPWGCTKVRQALASFNKLLSARAVTEKNQPYLTSYCELGIYVV